MFQKVSLLTLAAILFCLHGVIQGVGPLGLLIVMRRTRRKALKAKSLIRKFKAQNV